jgi:hypothetical protein
MGILSVVKNLNYSSTTFRNVGIVSVLVLAVIVYLLISTEYDLFWTGLVYGLVGFTALVIAAGCYKGYGIAVYKESMMQTAYGYQSQVMQPQYQQPMQPMQPQYQQPMQPMQPQYQQPMQPYQPQSYPQQSYQQQYQPQSYQPMQPQYQQQYQQPMQQQ